MKFSIRRKAFSLTELLIVLVVIAVLFSAMLPIMTKRRSGGTTGSEPVWQFVPGEQRDAFYDRNVPALSSTAFIGLDPNNLSANEKGGKYPSKVHIRAGQTGTNAHQHHIQFRYGNNNGALTGLFVINNKGNILGTGKLHGESGQNSNSILANPNDNTNNTVLGNGAFARIKKASGVTSIGSNSSMAHKDRDKLYDNVTAVGTGTNQYGKAGGSVLLGSNVGKTEDSSISATVAIGVNSLGLPTSYANESVLVGSDTATVGNFGEDNVVLGSNYIGTADSKYNTILGYGAFSNSATNSNAKYMTAIGDGTCNSFNKDNPEKKTCIGFMSAASTGSMTATKDLGWETDGLEHIFLGGAQQNPSVGGRAVLEVHNVPRGKMDKTGYVHPGGAGPSIAPTVVMNSNLVVRGNVYWPTTDGVLRPHSLNLGGGMDGKETGSDRCDRRCHSRFGRKYWRGGECGGIFADFIDWAGGVGGFVGTVLAWSISLVSAHDFVTATFGFGFSTAVDAFNGGHGDRYKDPVTANAVVFRVDDSDSRYYCASASQNYPVSGTGCPDLKLSDIRLKENVVENHDAIEKLLLVMPYDYTFKADKSKKPQVGVIAQDLQVYFPDSVREDNNGNLNIRLDEMFFASINSVKNLDKVVQNLESDVSVLESQTDKLDKAQKSTEKRISEMNKKLNKLEK